MKLHRIAAALALLSVTPQLASAGPVWSANGHEYELVLGNLSAVNANAVATAAGWYLATVTSAEEHEFIVANVLPSTPTNRAHFWIGGRDTQVEGSWLWLNGDPWGYTNWHSDEPNNRNNEDFLVYDYRAGIGWRWNDSDATVSCCTGFLQGYIRERTAVNSVPEPATLGLLLSGLAGIALRRRRRLAAS